MKLFYKKLTVLTLLIFGVFLTGCAQITYSRVVHKDGQVMDQVTVTLQTQKLNKEGIDITTLKADIKNDLNILYFANIREFINHLKDQNTAESIELSNKIRYVIETPENGDQIVASIHFLNKIAFDSYNKWVTDLSNGQNPPNEDENQELDNKNTPKVEKSTFYYKYTQSSQHVFTEDLFTKIPVFNYYNQNYAKNGLAFKDITFSQVYGNTDLRLKSNADNTINVHGIKLHQWNFTHPVLEDTRPLEFYTYIPNTPNWYLTAVAISLATAVVIITISLVTKKHKNIIAKK